MSEEPQFLLHKCTVLLALQWNMNRFLRSHLINTYLDTVVTDDLQEHTCASCSCVYNLMQCHLAEGFQDATRADGTYGVVRLVLCINCTLHGNAVAENNINEGRDM